jgi:hypothetical protein
MKTYSRFIEECYEYILEGAYNDEHALRKTWNHFMVHKKHGAEVRKHLDAGDQKAALDHMKGEVDKAKSDPKHPLSFEKSQRGFKGGKTDSDSKSYYQELDNAVQGAHTLATKERRTVNAAKKGLPMKNTGAGKAPVTASWAKTGATNTTPKRDVEIHDPKNPKYGVGISLKKSGGSQLMSGGPEETHATIKHAAKKHVAELIKSGKSKEEADAAHQDIVKRSERVSWLVKGMEKGSPARKSAIKQAAQRHIDHMHDNHPGLENHIGSEASSGNEKFGKRVSAGSGQASVVLKGADTKKGVEAKAQDIQRRERSKGFKGRLRAAKPKSDRVNPKTGRTRSGNVKLDER